jgi:PhzF family phenazine biosynthesis protein
MTTSSQKIRFVQVDAFAARAFEGNPAAVMPLDAWLDNATLQRIAAENNLSETAFVVATDGDADYELRWFTPAVEVAMCGHATLASGHVLLGDDPARDEIRFRTRKSGVLRVARAAAGYSLDLPSRLPTPKPLPDLSRALGGSPVETLWHPNGYALLAYADEAAIRALDPDFRALASASDTLVIATAPGIDTDIVSRVFAGSAGIDEDPVTGSAHAVLVPYWADRLGRRSFSAFQASARGGHLACEFKGDRVILGGACVTVIEGHFLL